MAAAVVVSVGYSVIVGELRTGRRLVALPVSAGSWSIAAGSAGQLSVTLPLLAADFQRLGAKVTGGLWPGGSVWPSETTFPHAVVTRWVPTDHPRRDIKTTTEPARMFLAILCGDRVVEAGPIWSREWDQDAGTLKINALGFRSLLDHRLVLDHLVSVTTPGAVAASSLSYSGLSLGTIAKRLVSEALAHLGGSAPVVLPADEAGNHTRTYPGSEMASVEQRMSELSQVDGGPEVEFQPRLTSDRTGVEWVMRVGTSAQPQLSQTGGDWMVDMSVPRGSLGGLTVSEDASAQVNRAWAKGSGIDSATVISIPATEPGQWEAGFPLLESVGSVGGDGGSYQDNVTKHAAGDLATNRRPWQTWRMKIALDGRVGAVRPGDWWAVRVGRDHIFIDEPGLYRARMASMSGQIGSEFVDVQLVPTVVA